MNAALLALFLAAKASAVAVAPPELRPEEAAEQALPAAAADAAPYDLKALPPSRADLSLLEAAHYESKPDGTLWAPGAESPVTKPEYPYLISKLEGSQRLKALIAIDMIYQRSDGGAALLPEDREALRKLLRENWRLFAVKTRRDFKKYFSPQEIEALQAQAKLDATLAPPPRPLPERPAPQVQAVSISPEELLPKSAPPPPPSPAPNPIIPAVLQPLGLAQNSVQPPPAPEPPKVSTPAAPAPPEITQALPLPAGWDTREGFETFLKGAPYSEEVKRLLKTISERAPDFARGRAIKLVASRLPEIAVDGSRMGAALRGRVTMPPGIVTLNPGPILYAPRSLFFAADEVLVGEAPETYRPLHLNAPPQALDRDRMPKKRVKTDWGDTEYFEDDSARGKYSEPELAGVLLHELLVLSQRLENPKAPAYLTELYARTAQLMLYAALRAPNNGDRFLDPSERAAFREWLAHPQEARDHLIHTFFAQSMTVLDDESAEAISRNSALSKELLRLETKFRQETPVE